MKKKIVSFIAAVVFAATLSACGGKPAKTGDAMYQIGKNALSVADEYISADITGSEAEERLKEFSTQADAQYDLEIKETGSDSLVGTDLSNDYFIKSAVYWLYSAVDGSISGLKAMSEVQEERDDLADALGESRKTEKKTKPKSADIYKYETEKSISDYVSEKLSQYDLDVFVYEESDGLRFDISAEKPESMAGYYFANALVPAVEAVSQAQKDYGFDISAVRISYLCYKNNADKSATSSITYSTNDLKKGMLISTKDYLVKTNITPQEAVSLLR